MYEKNQIPPAMDCAQATSVPDHLLGTRAAIFHILSERSDDDIATAKTIVSISTPACLKPTAKRFEWQNALPVDDFLFHSAE